MTIEVESNNAEADKVVNQPAKVGNAASTESNTSAPELKTQEQNESGNSETPETETNEGESTESENSSQEEHEETGETNGTEKTGKKKGGFQRRIDKLNQQKAAAQQEADFWKQQALKGASDPKSESKVETPKASEGKPKADDFNTHVEYVEALTDWKTDQKFKEHDQKQERSKFQSAQAEVAKTYSERVKEFEKATPDFNDVVAEVDGIQVSAAVREIIVTSENGPQLAYELAKDPEEFERINKLSPFAAAREVGKVEARLAPKASASNPPTNKITKAPKPIAPVGTGGKGTVAKSIYDPDLDQKTYERMRSEERKKRRQAG